MAHSNQARKRIRTSEAKRLQNKSVATRMKNEYKRVLTAAAEGDVAAAEKTLATAMKRIDKAAQVNVIHKNTAARKKSVMARAIERARAAKK